MRSTTARGRVQSIPERREHNAPRANNSQFREDKDAPGSIKRKDKTPAITLADKRTKSEMALEFAQLSTASYGRFDKRLARRC